MKKWSESKETLLSFEYIKKRIDGYKNIDLKIKAVSNESCNGEIRVTNYSDGTLAFMDELIVAAINEIAATKTKLIGKESQVISDFIFCDMQYGKQMRAQRDTIIIPFKFEEAFDEAPKKTNGKLLGNKATIKIGDKAINSIPASLKLEAKKRSKNAR